MYLHTICSEPHDSPLLSPVLPLICSAGLSVLPTVKNVVICVLAVRWRRWMPAACSWLLSSWLAWTRHYSSMTCAASRCHGNTVVPGASSTANCSRANWPGLPATGPLCWTCVRGRYEPECVCVWWWSMFRDNTALCALTYKLQLLFANTAHTPLCNATHLLNNFKLNEKRYLWYLCSVTHQTVWMKKSFSVDSVWEENYFSQHNLTLLKNITICFMNIGSTFFMIHLQVWIRWGCSTWSGLLKWQHSADDPT